MKITKLLVTVPCLFLLVAAIPQAKAWDGGYGPSWSGGGGGCGGFGCGSGYFAGQQNAVYDLQNNLQYQPTGSCLPCHSEGYWNNFKQGYDQIWNNHQSQESTQGSSININGNNNYVETNQNQQQNPLQQLARTVCGFINCQNNQEQQGGP